MRPPLKAGAEDEIVGGRATVVIRWSIKFFVVAAVALLISAAFYVQGNGTPLAPKAIMVVVVFSWLVVEAGLYIRSRFSRRRRR